MQGWAIEEFSGIDLGDTRLNERLIHIAESLSEQPTISVRQACKDAASAKGAFRFFDNEKVTSQNILKPHIESTLKRVRVHSKEGMILAIQDTSYLSYDHHMSTLGLGPISPGGQQSGCEGLIMHTCLAVSSKGETLGILGQKLWVRDEVKGREKSRLKIALEQKESFKWIEMIRQVKDLIDEEIAVVNIADREADIFSVFEESENSNSKFIIRAYQQRIDIETGKNLFKHLTSQPICGTVRVETTNPRDKSLEQMLLTVKIAQVSFKKDSKRIRVNAICFEEKTTKRNPLKWFLLTNLSVNNFEEAVEKMQWYRFRWRIETLHKIMKSGYQIESCRLRNANRLERYITLITILSWRLYWMKLMTDSHPNLPCTEIFDDEEWKAIYLRVHKTTLFPITPPTLRETMRDLAKLGGFLGRKTDGEPGIVTIWRGIFSLYETLQTLRLYQGSAAICGYK